MENGITTGLEMSHRSVPMDLGLAPVGRYLISYCDNVFLCVRDPLDVDPRVCGLFR